MYRNQERITRDREEGSVPIPSHYRELLRQGQWEMPSRSTGWTGLSEELSSFQNYYLLSRISDQLKYLEDRIGNLEENLVQLSKRINVFPVTINSIRSDVWSITNPLVVNVEQRSEDDFIACLYEAEIYGYGDSVPEALDDLGNAMINQLEALIEEETQGIELGPAPQNQKVILTEILSKKA